MNTEQKSPGEGAAKASSRQYPLLIAGLIALIIIAFFTAICVGRYKITVPEVLRIFGARLGMAADSVTADKKAEAARFYYLPGKFSQACGSVQHLPGDLYVIGWGWATKDNECMSVSNFATGKKLLSVTLENPKNVTYRCVYYE